MFTGLNGFMDYVFHKKACMNSEIYLKWLQHLTSKWQEEEKGIAFYKKLSSSFVHNELESILPQKNIVK